METQPNSPAWLCQSWPTFPGWLLPNYEVGVRPQAPAPAFVLQMLSTSQESDRKLGLALYVLPPGPRQAGFRGWANADHNQLVSTSIPEECGNPRGLVEHPRIEGHLSPEKAVMCLKSHSIATTWFPGFPFLCGLTVTSKSMPTGTSIFGRRS